ncbi:MAG: type III polyketide synthase [Kiloniellales bacterium]
MNLPVRLLSLATAVPPFVLRQEEVAARARALFAASGSEVDRLLPAFANAGIATRRSCVPLEWYTRQSGWKVQNALYLEHALALIERAATDCLERAGLAPEQVDAIVCVSTSGLATPSLDARLMERLPFRRDLQRSPIFGLGCAGGVLGLSRAAALARAAPGSRILFLVVELCGLTFRADDHSKSNFIAAALFGDGAAAAIVSCDEADHAQAALSSWGEVTWPRSLDVMGWRIEDDGFGVLFSKDIPSIIRDRYAAAVDDFLARDGLGRDDLDGVICHPGGAKVIDALEEVFGLPRGGMIHARSVLRDFGNMSAATVLFVLERTLHDRAGGRYLMSSLGPGFTAGFLLLELP